MWNEFADASAFDNTTDIGEVRERGLALFLSDRLPSKYKVARGEVVDAGGFQSGQTDILIYDGSSTAPLLTKPNGLVLLPVEALLASIEVKSKLTRDELKKSALGVGKLRSLRPFASPWGLPRRNGGHADDGLPTFFSTVFAYGSTIEKDWDSLEIQRIRDVCSKSEVPTEWIDRVVVLSRGIVLPAAGRVVRFQSDQQVLGLWFFHLMNFLARESARRAPFPWALYESSLSPQWTRQLPPLADAPVPKKASSASRKRYLRKAQERFPDAEEGEGCIGRQAKLGVADES
jgi:hypothetical protein